MVKQLNQIIIKAYALNTKLFKVNNKDAKTKYSNI